MGVVLYFFLYFFWVTQIETETKTSVTKDANQKPTHIYYTQLILKKMINKDEKTSEVNAADSMDKNQMVSVSIIGDATISNHKKRKPLVFIAVILFIVVASIITWKHIFQC